MELAKAKYRAQRELLKTGILRWHEQWQRELAAFVASPYPEGANAFDRSMEITKRARDFYKRAMAMEDYYRKSMIDIGIEVLFTNGCLTRKDLEGFDPEVQASILEMIKGA